MARSVLAGLCAILLSAPVASRAQESRPLWRIHLETGPVWQGRNEVQVPGDTGTRFGLNRLIGAGPFASVRLNALTAPDRRTGWRFIYAPFRIDGTGTLDGPTAFAGSTFAPGIPARGIYQFNSYRVSYWYRFHRSQRMVWRAGLTLKIRDALIALEQNGQYASEYDLGLVPLIHLSGEYHFAPRWHLLVDFDGLAAPQGRAFDLGVHLGYDLSPRLTLTLGYRTLEGGADNRTVYNFSWFNYLNTGLLYRF
ncbi:MAG: hypothetical protein RMJ43_13555 [Chloroherpetonaceae bacterium]|nr:hypothetical protein [Chthonomonadaceae bacterium]MDW8208855.1 hypothetical protein [Chloroherpetonaceae bacterium]